MIGAPGYKSVIRSVPDTANQKSDEQICQMSARVHSVSPQGDVDIICKP